MLLSEPLHTTLREPLTVSDMRNYNTRACSTRRATRYSPFEPTRPAAAATCQRSDLRASTSSLKGNVSPLLLSVFGKARISSASSSAPAHNRKPSPMSQRLIPTAASSWTKETLDALSAVYDRHEVCNFDFDDASLPAGLKDGMHGVFMSTLC